MDVKCIRNWLSINMKGLDLTKLITHFAQSNKAKEAEPVKPKAKKAKQPIIAK